MRNREQFIGKWKFNYWIELNETTILEINANGVAITSSHTTYKWEPIDNNGIRIYIDDYVEYIGYLSNGKLYGNASSDYTSNEWTWQAMPWKGPIITDISERDIENKIWKVHNSTDELNDFQSKFLSDGSLITEKYKDSWQIEDGKLIFTYANGFIRYVAEKSDNIIKGEAKNKTSFSWNFFLEYLGDVTLKKKKVVKPPIPTITVVPPRKFKEDRDKILQYLKDKGVEYFYHFTDISNIPLIKKYGGLFSSDYIRKKGLPVSKQGGDDTSKGWDKHYKLEDYIHLSFCNNHPMAYKCKTERQITPVLLKIKIEVAMLLDTRFSNMNAVDRYHEEGPSFEDLLKVRIPATRMSYLRHTDEYFKFHQAEVMVKRHIPLEYIVNIDNPERMTFGR